MPTTRVQLALNVDDLAAATAFYTAMFGVPPHKQREGYANFAVEDPPLKLVLIEKPGDGDRLNHLGVEAQTSRGGDRGPDPASEGPGWKRRWPSTTCAATPHRTRCSSPPRTPATGWWEYYAVTDDSATNPDGESTSVCAA